MLIEWRKEFETGVAEVDFEHRELVDLINALHSEIEGDAPRERISSFLGEVFARIAAHFALEETVMRKHGYDDYAAHKAEHETLLDEIRDIMDAHEQGNASDYGTTLGETVAAWFVNHFKTRDARLHRMLGV
jgi:hemerythrin